MTNKIDPAKFQKDATNLKFPSGNQSDEDIVDISKLDADKCAILQLSKENSCKLLLLASALENTDTSKKMSDSKLQKCFLDSAKQLKLKEFKYDSNPSMCQCLFQSFYDQLIFYFLLTYVDTHFKMILQRKETNGFGDKSVLDLQAQCASHHFSMARDKAETVRNEYTNDALVDFFLF